MDPERRNLTSPSGGAGSSADRVDRSVGALLGLACGDSVGTTLEFRKPGTFAPIEDMVGGGPFGLEPGQWTDDTSMALCLAESILDTGAIDLADQMRRYLLWHSNGYLSSTGRCFDIGNATRSQLARFARTGDPIDPTPDEDAAANGSLMRLAAVPIRWQFDVAEAAERSGESSRPTHPASRPVDACRVLGAMTAALIGGAPSDEVFSADSWQLDDLPPEVEAVARGSWRHKQQPEIRGTGYCVDALEAAIWAVAGADDFRSAVLRAANLGDDADTTAAIAGQLAGARWGASGIPPAWRERVTDAERITSLAQGLHRAAAGEPTPTSWAFERSVHAWSVSPGVLAGEYPGHTQPARAAAKLALLVDAGIRTFVDLTEEHELEPYGPVVEQVAANRALSLQHRRFPIPDFGVVTTDGYRQILDAIGRGSERGGVYVHCWGGVGRTGTVVGCLLADSGLAGDDALRQLQHLRRGTHKADRASPESDAQRAVVLGWSPR